MRIHLPAFVHRRTLHAPARELLDALVRVPVADDRLRAYERAVLPNLMRAAYPKPGVDADLSDLTVYRTVAFCLRHAQKQQADREACAALQRRIDELEGAGTMAVAVRAGSSPGDLEALVEQRIVEPLRRGASVLMPGGFLRVDAGHRERACARISTDGHAAALYLRPDASGHTRLFVCDRVAGKHPYLLRDRAGKRLPLVWDVATQALITPAACRRWARLMRLQRGTSRQDAGVYYRELERLLIEANGTLRVGKRDGHRVCQVAMPAQSVQKSGTCSWHATWAWLRVALQCDLGAPPTSWSDARITGLYKALKEASRAQIRRASR